MTQSEVDRLLENQRQARERAQKPLGWAPGMARPAPPAHEVTLDHVLALLSDEDAPAARTGRGVRLVLPYPPSANSLYRTIVRGNRAIPIKSKEHRAFFEAVEAALPRGLRPFGADMALAVTLRLFRPRKQGDVDGPIKALLDSLNGHAWADDSQVAELHVFRGDCKERPRVEVDILEVRHGG